LPQTGSVEASNDLWKTRDPRSKDIDQGVGEIPFKCGWFFTSRLPDDVADSIDFLDLSGVGCV
jgi:hypothetical protein